MRTRLALFLVLLAWGAMPPTLHGQVQKYEGLSVVNIQFDPMNQPLEPSELFAILPLKRGQPLRAADVRTSIDRLFATGRYADIQVDAETYNGGVIIRFITKNSWFIGNVKVAGKISNPPNAGQLENATQLELGQPYTEIKLQQAIEGQRRLLLNNGLYRPTIRPIFDYDDQYQQVHIRFEVDSGPRARFSTPTLLGDLKMDPTRIVAATKWRRWLLHTWKPVTQDRVRRGTNGVESLYQKQNRLEAKVILEQMTFDAETQTALPTLRIDAGPRIQVNAIGARIPQKRLRQYVPVYEEHAVDHDLLVEGARNLRDYLQSEGFFESDVEFKEQTVENDQASLDYLINRGERHRLVALNVTGNKYFTTDAMRERMFLQTASFLQYRHGRYSEALLKHDENAITSLYQSNGFRDVKVTHRVEDDYQGRKNDLGVFIQIEEGPQYFVSTLTVEGIQKLNKAAILATLSSVAGQPYSEFNVAVDRDTILARYFRNGFPQVTFEWSSRPAEQSYRVDLRFVINEGPQQTIRQVLVGGLGATRPGLVNRALRLNPGDPLSPTAIADTQRRLYDLGVFERINAAIQDPDGDTPSKYVLFQIDEAHRYSAAVGLGAELARIGGCQTCLDAPAGATGFSPRVSFNITRNNIWGIAHSLSLRTRVSTLEQQALLNYSWPRFRNNDKLNLSFIALYEQSRDVRTFTYKREEISPQLSQRLTKATTLLYRYTYRRVSIDQATLKINPLLIPLLSQPVLLGQLSGNLIQDRRDDPLDPHKGIYNTLDIGLAEHFFGSERDFVRFLARNSTYHPIGKKLVLARSTEVGDIHAFHFQGDVLDAIPLPERFFAGGANSNRGFPDFQAGPRDTETGFPLGGTALFFNQTELRFPLIGDNVGGVLFHDAGNVYSSLGNFSFRVHQKNLQDFDYMVHAAGFGLRYRTPIGPVRLDLAYSINPPNFFGFKGSQQDLVNAGVNPCSPPPGVASQCVAQNVSHFQFFFSIGQTF
ncbi:MAG TPA: BamA/TamA family outer membrane protein [Bryobacteraceae bacterium]|nr:BamA/TamA family outer membrane protein [Bryobacteraceae bacterium]